MVITANELTQARADVRETLVNTIIIQRKDSSATAEGFFTDTWATVDTVAGRLDIVARRSDDGMVGAKEQGVAWYQLSVEWDADLADGDRISVGGTLYNVIQAQVAQDARIVRRALVAKI